MSDRVLKPCGSLDRTKAIKLWTESNEFQRVMVCAGYFHYHGGFSELQAYEITLPNGEQETHGAASKLECVVSTI